ncbi:putative peptidylprolyl isomerase [Helianthus anomalus]
MVNFTLTTPCPSLHHGLAYIKASSSSSKPNLTLKPEKKKGLAGVGIGLLAASMLLSSPLDANATRIEYYATVAEPPCDLQFAPSGLGYCDLDPGFGEQAPYSTLINVSSFSTINISIL